MTKLAYFVVVAALLSGCDADQDLGDTATDGTSTSTTGLAETGSNETTSGGGTSDSGPTTGGVDTGAPTVSGTGEASTGEASTGGSGGPVLGCEDSKDLVEWQSEIFIGSLGVTSDFAGSGDCAVGLAKPSESATHYLQLECTLSGVADGMPVTEEAYSLRLDFFTAGDLEFPSFAPSMHIRIVVAPEGLENTGNRHVVLEQPALPNDGFAPVLIATDAHDVRPSAALFADFHQGDWYAGPSFEPVDATCETGTAPTCGFDVAVAAGWLAESPTEVHGGQVDNFAAPISKAGYDVHVGAAWQAPNNLECGRDFPGAEYRFVAFANL